MQFFKTRKMIMVFLAVIIVGVIGTAVFLKYNKDNIVRASASDNVHGFAWSELYGWISFNSADCDTDSNGKIDSGNCGSDNASLSVKNYGMAIDVITGNTTGYAWNPLLGYICIGSTCTAGIVPVGGTHAANYNSSSGRLSGWANILSQGDNGWIRFDNVATSSNGVSIDADTGIMNGWAWNGNGDDGNPLTFDGVGWISFNCDDSGAGGCSTSPYAVTANVNRPPNLSNIDTDYSGANDPCLPGNTVKDVALRWNYSDDDMQSGYNITLTPPASGPYYASTTDNSSIMTGLSYNDTYSYTLTVWDSGSPALSTTTTGTFTTKVAEYPEVSFTWFAPNPSAEEQIMFTGVSEYYNGGVATGCTSSTCTWGWTTSKVEDNINTPTASSTIITFANKGINDMVTFTATSSTGNLSCSTSTIMKVSEKLPNWREK